MAASLPNQFAVVAPTYSAGKDPGMHIAAREWSHAVVINGGTSDAFVRVGLTPQVDHIGTQGTIGLSGAGWSLGTNWSVVGGRLHHATGNTATAVATLIANIPGGTPRIVSFDLSNYVIGTVAIRVGASTSSRGANGAYSEGIESSTDTTQVTVTPSSTFVGDVDNIGVWTNGAHDTASGYYDHKVPAGATVDVTHRGRVPVTNVSVYVPAGGTNGSVIVVGREARKIG